MTNMPLLVLGVETTDMDTKEQLYNEKQQVGSWATVVSRTDVPLKYAVALSELKFQDHCRTRAL